MIDKMVNWTAALGLILYYGDYIGGQRSILDREDTNFKGMQFLK